MQSYIFKIASIFLIVSSNLETISWNFDWRVKNWSSGTHFYLFGSLPAEVFWSVIFGVPPLFFIWLFMWSTSPEANSCTAFTYADWWRPPFASSKSSVIFYLFFGLPSSGLGLTASMSCRSIWLVGLPPLSKIFVLMVLFSSYGRLTGAKGEIMYSAPSDFLTSLLYPCANSQIFSSDAYYVLVSKYYLCSGLLLRCFIFYLQLSICQHLMHRTSLFDFVFIWFNLLMNVPHSAESLFIITLYVSANNHFELKMEIWILEFYLMEYFWLGDGVILSIGMKRERLVFSIKYKRTMNFAFKFYKLLISNHKFNFKFKTIHIIKKTHASKIKIIDFSSILIFLIPGIQLN